MFLSAVPVLVVAQSSSEIPEGLMNNPVFHRNIKSTDADVVSCGLTFWSRVEAKTPDLMSLKRHETLLFFSLVPRLQSAARAIEFHYGRRQFYIPRYSFRLLRLMECMAASSCCRDELDRVFHLAFDSHTIYLRLRNFSPCIQISADTLRDKEPCSGKQCSVIVAYCHF